MAITQVTDATAKYRTAITAADTADLAALVGTVFTRTTLPIPVVPVVGAPNVYVRAQTTNTADAIVLMLVALRATVNSATPAFTVVSIGQPLTLTSGGTGNPATGTAPQFMTPVSVNDAQGGAGASQGSGPVTHVAFMCVTAPTGGRAVDLYAWAAA